MQDCDFYNFIANVKRKIGIDLAKYKEEQMKRRLTNLYIKHGYKNFDEFFRSILNETNLFHEFLDQITINVTEFYRNPIRWEILHKDILPQIIRENRKLKCWSAACSTGEEPYTLAMILNDMEIKNAEINASDFDEVVLSTAQQGFYGERALKDLPEKFRDKYFHKRDFIFEISSTIKKNVKFKRLDLLTDPFDSEYDLIICRNVMIYFTEQTNAELYKKLSDSLRIGGVLFVGSTEQIFRPQQYRLEMIDTFFYRKI